VHDKGCRCLHDSRIPCTLSLTEGGALVLDASSLSALSFLFQRPEIRNFGTGRIPPLPKERIWIVCAFSSRNSGSGGGFVATGFVTNGGTLRLKTPILSAFALLLLLTKPLEDIARSHFAFVKERIGIVFTRLGDTDIFFRWKTLRVKIIFIDTV